MGKKKPLKGMKLDQLTDPANYLDSVGVKNFPLVDEYWSYMGKRYGESECYALSVAGDLASSGITSEAVYDFMYSDLDLSLDINSTRRDFYCKFLQWFISTITEFEGKLLDIGCGNGVLSCFYAIRYPSAHVVGIDASSEAIDCAQLLAERLHLKNIEFLVADYNSESWPLEERSVDLAVSATGIEPRKFRRTTTGDLIEWVDSAGSAADIPAVKNLGKYLKESGNFLSFDSCAGDHETELCWLLGLQNAGLAIDFARSGRVSFAEFGKSYASPALVCKAKGEKIGAVELISWGVTKRDNVAEISLADPNWLLSEVLFSAINPKQFIAGWTAAQCDKSGITHFEIWQSGVLILFYMWNTCGFRRLSFAPAYLLDVTRRKIEQGVDARRKTATVTEYTDDPADRILADAEVKLTNDKSIDEVCFHADTADKIHSLLKGDKELSLSMIYPDGTTAKYHFGLLCDRLGYICIANTHGWRQITLLRLKDAYTKMESCLNELQEAAVESWCSGPQPDAPCAGYFQPIELSPSVDVIKAQLRALFRN